MCGINNSLESVITTKSNKQPNSRYIQTDRDKFTLKSGSIHDSTQINQDLTVIKDNMYIEQTNTIKQITCSFGT